jgi:hypothetical protein
MKTTLLIRPTPSRRDNRHTCSTIRPAERLPSSPPMPVAQNLHPTGQPTCDEMHAVRLARVTVPSSSSSDSAGIITHSVCRSVREYGIAPGRPSAPRIGSRVA